MYSLEDQENLYKDVQITAIVQYLCIDLEEMN